MKQIILILILLTFSSIIVFQFSIGFGSVQSSYILDWSYVYSGLSLSAQIGNIGLFDYAYTIDTVNWNDQDIYYTVYKFGEYDFNIGFGISSIINPVFTIYKNSNILLDINSNIGCLFIEIEVPTWQFSNIGYVAYYISF